MADKIVVLQAGNIEQVGSPLELYRNPVNRFVAGFIGSPKMNFVEGSEAVRRGAHAIGVRPEHVALSKESGAWKGTVGVSEHLGSDTFCYVNVDGVGTINVRTSGEVSVRHGDTVWLTPAENSIHRFDEKGAAIR